MADKSSYDVVPVSEQPDEKPIAKERKAKDGGCWANNKKVILVGIAIIFAIAIIAGIIIYMVTRHTDPSVQVSIDCFTVKGEASKKGYVFRGIPYAEPPVGELRWRPPQKIEPGKSNCNKTTIDANKFKDMCAQASLFNVSYFSGSEDCLYLNVWTPTLDSSQKLPVMVWIHGGYLIAMDGNLPTYSPTVDLAVETNIVYVSMNYRLTAFGFMALDILSQDSETKTSGNYGFMDQIAVLEWVKRNIGVFGGDPNKVTLFGQSSGGTSINALLATRMAKGLFHRAWSLSSSPIFNKSLADASQDNEVFLQNTGCSEVQCLRNLTMVEVLKATPYTEYPFWLMADLMDLPEKNGFDGALPVIDGYMFEKVPIEAWKSGELTVDVPLVLGDTAQEIDIWPTVKDLKTWTKNDYEGYVRGKLNTFSEDIANRALELYPYTDGSNAEYLFTTMVSDARIICPTGVLASAMASAAKDVNVYWYIATAKPSSPASYYGIGFKAEFAFHGIDSFAFFDSWKEYITLKDSDVAFQTLIREEILHFVRTGKVRSEQWLPYPNTTALLGIKLRVVDEYQKERCNFWIDNGFFSYAWIN